MGGPGGGRVGEGMADVGRVDEGRVDDGTAGEDRVVDGDNNNNNVHLSCAYQRPERSHDTY